LSIENAVREIIESLLQSPSPSGNDLSRAKMKTAQKYQLDKLPSNSQIIAKLKTNEKVRLMPLLRRKAMRTISGVTVIAVMTKPYPCPQPEPCAYCPGGPAHGVPQSYTGFEPAAMRGIQNDYDPYLQVKSRIEQLKAIGHNVDKIELIVMGGTFPAAPMEYQTWFVQRCLDAVTNKQSTSLDEAKRNAEHSKIRNSGITVETRPDWAKEEHVDRMLSMGVTRVELGVQNPNNRIYCMVGRTHTVKDVIEATRIMKDAGLKIVYHMMPGMPNSGPEKDLEAFRKIFTDPNFKPDMIKIYPCLVMKDTKAHKWFQEGTFKPYTSDRAANLIARVKRTVPPWIRIMRVQRDIPAQLIVAGVKKSNLRELVQEKLKKQNAQCRCIRCREIGHRTTVNKVDPDPENIQTLVTKYDASQGKEIFISSEDIENDLLVGYLRLRIPSNRAHRPEVNSEPCSIVRELHVYGPLVPVGKRSARAWQHKGYGKTLLAKAEEITKEDYGFKKILVISALGTKQYYKRFGYWHDGVYMSKMLR
jgi:elongator complex protein 3